MTRTIDSATETASQAATIHPVLFVDLGFDSGTVRFHSEIGDIAWGGNTYTGTGRLGSVSAMDEDSELSRTPITMTLSGIPNDLLSAVLSQHYQGRTATVYLGYLDDDRDLVADPTVVYRGRMDTPQVERGGTLSITLSVESRFAAWDRPLSLRYNNATQQSLYPGDKGLEYVEQASDKQIFWGQAG